MGKKIIRKFNVTLEIDKENHSGSAYLEILEDGAPKEKWDVAEAIYTSKTLRSIIADWEDKIIAYLLGIEIKE